MKSLARPALFDSTQAVTEGWDLFQVDYRLQLCRIDWPADHDLGYDEPKFSSDADAVIFVALAAHNGSEYHRNALHEIGRLVEDD